MNDPAAISWTEANQRYLVAAVARVRVSLERHARRLQNKSEEAEPDPAADQALGDTAEALPAPCALETLCAAFCLSPFERDVLLLCAGMELESAFAASW